MEFILILGCWGEITDGFTMCPGTSNIILDLSSKSKRVLEVIDYLDGIGLFDKYISENVHTIIWNIQNNFSDVNHKIFNPKLFQKIERFCINHKKCGLFLRLDFRRNDE